MNKFPLSFSYRRNLIEFPSLSTSSISRRRSMLRKRFDSTKTIFHLHAMLFPRLFVDADIVNLMINRPSSCVDVYIYIYIFLGAI